MHRTDASVFDYLPDAVFVIDEPGVIESSLGKLYETLAHRYAENESADDLGLTPEELYLSPERLRDALFGRQKIELRALGRAAAAVDESFALEAEQPSINIGRATSATAAPLFLFPAVEAATEVEWLSTPARRYHGLVAELAKDVGRARVERGATTLFAMPSHGIAERIVEMLGEYHVNARIDLPATTEIDGDAAHVSPAVVAIGRLSAGFELPGSGLVVHVETDVFDQASDAALERRAPPGGARKSGDKKRKSKTAAFLSDFRDLKVGDYVVHIDHGIARFGGLQTLDLQGRQSEFMLLFYAEDAKLYVPVERLDLVQRYSSAEGHEPQLDRLGGLGWLKTKAKAKRAMRDMADELLRLYAEKNWSAATRLRPTLRGSASLKKRLSTRRRPTRKRPLKT
ncbi:MAG: CarD family transcriptional regulator [Pyrinomonadaceae bacterium]